MKLGGTFLILSVIHVYILEEYDQPVKPVLSWYVINIDHASEDKDLE